MGVRFAISKSGSEILMQTENGTKIIKKCVVASGRDWTCQERTFHPGTIVTSESTMQNGR
jgi:hypothetical protein